MTRLLEKVARARDARLEAERQHEKADERFRTALVQARAQHSWAELAEVAQMSRSGVKYLVMGEEAER